MVSECIQCKQFVKTLKSGICKKCKEFNIYDGFEGYSQKTKPIKVKPVKPKRKIINKKQRIRNKTKYLVSSGKLPHVKTVKCKKCDNMAQEYHHFTYDSAYDVIPLCIPCHNQTHLDMGGSVFYFTKFRAQS